MFEMNICLALLCCSSTYMSLHCQKRVTILHFLQILCASTTKTNNILKMRHRRNRNVFGKQPRAAMLVLIVEVGSSLFCIKANIGESNDKLVILFTQYHRIPMQPPNIFRIKPLDGENCLQKEKRNRKTPTVRNTNAMCCNTFFPQNIDHIL